jgi:hypothetical protein
MEGRPGKNGRRLTPLHSLMASVSPLIEGGNGEKKQSALKLH